VAGALRVTFHLDGAQTQVTLAAKGDYVVFGPDVVHSWEALGETIVLSVGFPSVEVGLAPVDDINVASEAVTQGQAKAFNSAD
jgi:quercetin dioxygenase-like cupin family protein